MPLTERSDNVPRAPKMQLAPPASFTALTVALAMALSGCATTFLEPKVELPAQYMSAADDAQSEPDVAWWQSYGDPVLPTLMARAARQNRDVQIAAERVRAARAGVTINRSAMLPNVGFTAGASDRRSAYSDAKKELVPDMVTASVGLDVSWEIDLSGRLRAATSAATADALAAEHAERGVRLLVLTDVAENYFTLVGATRQLETVRAIAAAQDETLRLVIARRRAGLATEFDVERARTDAARASAAIPPLETLVAVSRHRIGVLTGEQAVNGARLAPWSGELALPEAKPGQPASLLQRRPDLLALNAQLEAANYRRQQAKAEWFPRLFIGALLGGQSNEINGFDLGAVRFTNAAGLLTVPLFNAGRISAINEASSSAQTQALLRYEDGIVRALEDVENALVSLSDERRRNASLQLAASSAEAALGRAQSLYDRGQIDLLPLLDAQRARLVVRVSANDSNTQLLLDSVRLFKALGGGWQAFEPATSAAASAAAANGAIPPSPKS